MIAALYARRRLGMAREVEWTVPSRLSARTLLSDDAPHFKVQCGLLSAPAALLTQSRRLG